MSRRKKRQKSPVLTARRLVTSAANEPFRLGGWLLGGVPPGEPTTDPLRDSTREARLEARREWRY